MNGLTANYMSEGELFPSAVCIGYNSETGFYQCQLVDGTRVDGVDENGDYNKDGIIYHINGWSELIRAYKQNNLDVLKQAREDMIKTMEKESAAKQQEELNQLYKDKPDDYQFPWQERNNN